MNKGSKLRQKQIWETAKASGGFPKPVYRKKAKPFPKGVVEMTMAQQREIFYGKKVN
jgi:hypothetical protein